jgi:hypothetical protein
LPTRPPSRRLTDIVRDTLGTAIYFAVYESGKQLVNTLGGDHPIANKLAVLMSGGLCGIVSWAMICKLPNFCVGCSHFLTGRLDPIDSAKSIYQKNSLMYSRGQKVEPRPKIKFFKRHMYRGLGVSMMRSCAVNAIFFSSFEFIKNSLLNLKEEKPTT